MSVVLANSAAVARVVSVSILFCKVASAEILAASLSSISNWIRASAAVARVVSTSILFSKVASAEILAASLSSISNWIIASAAKALAISASSSVDTTIDCASTYVLTAFSVGKSTSELAVKVPSVDLLAAFSFNSIASEFAFSAACALIISSAILVAFSLITCAV